MDDDGGEGMASHRLGGEQQKGGVPLLGCVCGWLLVARRSLIGKCAGGGDYIGQSAGKGLGEISQLTNARIISRTF